MRNIFLILSFLLVQSAKAQVDKNAGGKSAVTTVGIDTLNILFSAANNIFYYTSPLEADASNFNVIDARHIYDCILLAQNKAKQKNHSLIIVLKIQKEKALNEDSKGAIEMIKRQANYKQDKLSATERQLIKLTEDSSNKK
jgi:hypothetical protein